WVDLTPRPKGEVIDVTRSAGEKLAAVLVTMGVIALLIMLQRPYVGRASARPNDRRAEARPTWGITVVLLIILARVALLAVRVDGDAWRIFTFDVYASRILGPFSRSPFDLLMTAAAVLAIAVAVTRRRSPSALSIVARTIGALVAAYGFVILIGNL